MNIKRRICVGMLYRSVILFILAYMRKGLHISICSPFSYTSNVIIQNPVELECVGKPTV